MSQFETLIESKGYNSNERWSPSSVSSLEDALSNGSFYGMSKALRKNIAYSLQYLQYVQLQIGELKLHSVIYTQLVKSYIIISMGIVEGVFYHLLKSNNQYKKEEWIEYEKVTTNAFKRNDGVMYKNEIVTYQKQSRPTEGRMDFDSMINKVRSKNYLKLSQAAYPYIKDLKEVRNKVHLHIGKNDRDTDYNNLSYVDYYLARYALYKIITNEVFLPKDQNGALDWICPHPDIISEITPILEERRKNKNKQI